MFATVRPTRRQLLKALAALGGLALASCAPAAPTAAPTAAPKQEEPKPQPTEAKAAATPKEVRYFSWWPLFISGVFPQIEKDFKDKFPNVTIKIEEVPYGEALTKYTTTLSAGTSADVLFHMNFMSQYFTKGLILDLTPRFEKDGFVYERDFYQGLGIDKWAGKIYGFPHLFETCLILYNKTMVKQAWGKDLWEAFPDGNWDISDMITIGKACAKGTGDKMEQWGAFIPYSNYYYGMEVLPWTMGDSIFDIQKMQYNFSTPAVQEVSNMLLDGVKKDRWIISDDDQSEINKAASTSYAFFAGKVAFHLRMSPDVGSSITVIGDKFEWDAFFLPNSKDNKAVTRAGGHGNNIYAKTKVPDEAYEFCKFLGTTPGQMPQAKARILVPVFRKDPALRQAWLTGNPKHDSVIFGVLEDRGGYGDHMRFNNEDELLRMFTSEVQKLYALPHAEAKNSINGVMKQLETDMNKIVDYGSELPFQGMQFPFKPPK